jgi:L-threonylcarbamoyladenylate synthase
MAKPQHFTGLADPKLTQLLLDHAVGILPTDTLYGLVTKADEAAAVARLYSLKNRESKPGTLIAASIDQLIELGLTRRYLTAVADFWPNPLSIVLPAPVELDYLTQGQHTLAVRIPADLSLSQLLERTGPLITTSANHPGEPTATTVDLAEAVFGNQVDFYVDGGSYVNHEPSTVIRIIDDAIEILRPGATKFDEDGRIVS